MALFGEAPLGSTRGHKHLVEMKAGKMHRKGTWVYPDKRRGMLYMYQNSEFLMHFCWKERARDHVEDDFIIFPDESSYSRVPECTTGRVYVLKFHASLIRVFYWLQEPKTDKDEVHCRIINGFLNHPLRPLSRTYTNKLRTISQSHLRELFGPEAATQLASIFRAQDGGAATSQTHLDKNQDVPNIPNNTPSSGRSADSLDSKHRKRSSLKTDVRKDSAKKNVTIADEIQFMDNMGFGGDEDQWEDDEDLGYEGNDEESANEDDDDDDDDDDEDDKPPKKK